MRASQRSQFVILEEESTGLSPDDHLLGGFNFRVLSLSSTDGVFILRKRDVVLEENVGDLLCLWSLDDLLLGLALLRLFLLGVGVGVCGAVIILNIKSWSAMVGKMRNGINHTFF